MVHAPGIPVVNLDIVDRRMHTIPHPLIARLTGVKTVTPTFHPLWMFNVLAFFVKTANASVTTALGPVGPEERIVQHGVRRDPVITGF
jgi:hypothetical protein